MKNLKNLLVFCLASFTILANFQLVQADESDGNVDKDPNQKSQLVSKKYKHFTPQTDCMDTIRAYEQSRGSITSYNWRFWDLCRLAEDNRYQECYVGMRERGHFIYGAINACEDYKIGYKRAVANSGKKIVITETTENQSDSGK